MSAVAAHHERMVWRPSALVAVLSGGVLLAFGLVTRDPIPFFLAIPLLLAPAAAAAERPPGGSPGRLEWRVDGTGPSVEIVGTIGLPPGVDPSRAHLTFYRPGPLVELRPPEVRPTDRELAFRLHWEARTPLTATIPLPELVWRDGLGMAERGIVLEGPALLLERFPPELVRMRPPRLDRTTPLPGEVLSPHLGGIGEFHAIRLAIPSDPPRRINRWASARLGRLVANDFRLERTGDLLVVVDIRPTDLGAEVDETLLSVSCAAALGVASAFLREKNRVGVAVFGESMLATPLASGRVQRARIARLLKDVFVPLESGPSERLAVSVRRFYPPGVTTLLISPLLSPDAEATVVQLRRRGFPTVVLSPSPVAVLTGAATSGSIELVARRLLRLVRHQRIRRIRELARVVDWEEFWSLGGLVDQLSQPVLTRGRR